MAVVDRTKLERMFLVKCIEHETLYGQPVLRDGLMIPVVEMTKINHCRREEQKKKDYLSSALFRKLDPVAESRGVDESRPDHLLHPRYILPSNYCHERLLI